MSSNTAAVSSGKPSSNTKVSTSTVTGRPTLKNLTRARVPRAGLIGVVFATTGALSWKFLISDKHKRSIASFYK